MTSWPDVRERLERELEALADEAFVVLGEPEPPQQPARGLLRRRPPAAPTRYAQVRRAGEHWYAECVGASFFGGDWDVDDATHRRLRDAGWRVPGETDPSGVEATYPNYWQVVPVGDTARVATACTDALALLGADPSSLEWRSGS